MAWVKIDDGFYTHPKVMAAGTAAIGLWLKAATYCAHQLTDGFVPEHMLPLLGGTRAQVGKLLGANLWESAEGGWVFHDWADYQPSRADTVAYREAERRRKAAWRAAKTQKRDADE